ncbi:MAG: S8 family serine peptidase, partial [Candidatus Kapaibacterium sp.]
MSMKHLVALFLSWSVLMAAPGDVCLKFASPEQARAFSEANLESRLIAPSSSPALFSAVSDSARAALRELRCWVVVRMDGSMSLDSLVSLWRLRYGVSYAAPAVQYSVERGPVRDSLRDFQWALALLKADAVWKRSTGKGVTVGVIDTGIDWDHEDLRSQVWVNVLEDLNADGRFQPWPVSEFRDGVRGDLDGMDNDGNGFTDDVIGYNFVDQRTENLGDWKVRDPFPYDEGGHGTNVAGVIAAAHDNGHGVSGLAHGSRLLTLRAFDVSGHA